MRKRLFMKRGAVRFDPKKSEIQFFFTPSFLFVSTHTRIFKVNHSLKITCGGRRVVVVDHLRTRMQSKVFNRVHFSDVSKERMFWRGAKHQGCSPGATTCTLGGDFTCDVPSPRARLP